MYVGQMEYQVLIHTHVYKHVSRSCTQFVTMSMKLRHVYVHVCKHRQYMYMSTRWSHVRVHVHVRHLCDIIDMYMQCVTYATQ